MEDNGWDGQLRDLLGDYKPGDIPSASGTSPGNMNTNTPPEQDPDSLLEQSWKRIEATLDANDQAFDESLRRKIAHYHPPYDSSSWHVFAQRFADHRFLRVRLVMLKMIEVSALVLLLITAVKFGFITQLQHNIDGDQIPAQQQPMTDENPVNHQDAAPRANASSSENRKNMAAAEDGQVLKDQRIGNLQTEGSNEKVSSSALAISDVKHTVESTHVRNTNPLSNTGNSATVADAVQVSDLATTTAQLPAIDINAIEEIDAQHGIHDIASAYDQYITAPISALESDIDFENAITVPQPKFVKGKQRKYVEFAVLAQSDYNGLRMPEDRLVTSGQQIVFPQQGIMSHGFGGGFTIGVGHPKWALETGVIYSAKDFKPGRQLIVGGVFDNGRIDFQAMKLQIISVPLQYRYRFDREGRMKVYGLVGGGFNMIVQSDIDVQIKYSFQSSAFGTNPNTDPDLEETIRESRRIREHIRDGAPFSTKTFLSINTGAGIEYQLSEFKTLFMQGTVLYQIPDLEFSNNNGKHLRSVSLQVGVRTPLGK